RRSPSAREAGDERSTLPPQPGLRQNMDRWCKRAECGRVRQLELLLGAGLREPDQEPYRIMTRNAPAIVPPVDGRQSQTALKVARGVARLLHAHGYCVVSELPLTSGPRPDLRGARTAGRDV